MAAIDPETTTKVPAEQATAAAANARRRTRPAPEAVPEVPPAGEITQALARGAAPGGLDDATLTRVLAGLGYGAEQGPVILAHTADEGSLIEFVDTGVVRFPAPQIKPDTPLVYRLRPPLFGEHKRMRLALEDVLLELDEAKLEYQADTVAANEAKAAARVLEEPERSRAMLAAKRLQRDADRAADGRTEAILFPWWAMVFETVGLDGVPADNVDGWGPWILDTDLAVRVINHWRTSPTAPGR